jgi:endonuclease YncB( thermonuclease family)
MSASASRLIAFLALAIAVSLAACVRAPSSLFADTRATAAVAAAPQILVLRDDVLVIDGRHLRLAGASAPQAAPLARCAAEAVASRQAEIRLGQLARGVRRAAVLPTGGLDDQGRILARVLFDGVDPAQTLINEGLAVTAQRTGFDWCAPTSTQPAAGHIAVLSYAGG